MNPETRGYLEQPDFQKILQDLGSNPQNMTQHLMDPRLQKAMEVGMGISLGGMGGAPGGMGGMGGMGASSMNTEPKESKPPAPAPEPEPVVEVEMTEEEKAEADLKEKALVVCTLHFCCRLITYELFKAAHMPPEALVNLECTALRSSANRTAACRTLAHRTHPFHCILSS